MSETNGAAPDDVGLRTNEETAKQIDIRRYSGWDPKLFAAPPRCADGIWASRAELSPLEGYELNRGLAIAVGELRSMNRGATWWMLSLHAPIG